MSASREYLFRRVVLGVARSDADIDADRDAVAAQREWLCNALSDAASDFLRFADCRQVAKDDRKFVTAEPRDRVRRRDHPDKSFRRDHQHLVADRVAQTVVYVLEPLDVEKQYMKIL